MVAMARALLGKPRVLCMDEPTMGLSPLWVDRVLELVQTINRQGTTVFMVEQNARAALKIAHRGYVLRHGVVTLSGTAAELLDNSLVENAYLGGKAI
jgi:ABC-type branched-chain amino acid transport systems, ATPase component